MNINESVVTKTSEYFKGRGIILPKISELVNPQTIDQDIINKLKSIDKNEPNYQQTVNKKRGTYTV